MTDKQYAAFKRAAFAAKKLQDGRLTKLTPHDRELITSLLKHRDDYVKAALADNRTAEQARQDIDRCERVAGSTTCKHGHPLCPTCATEKTEIDAKVAADIEAAFS